MMTNIIYPHHEISRIITAAVVNQRFRQDLLADPRHAIENGYGDEIFNLEKEQADQLANIHANSLIEFAMKVIFA